MDSERALAVQRNREAVAPILAELAIAGIPVQSLAHLDSRNANYRAAIPILLRWLDEIKNDDVKKAIVRALSVRWARPTALPALIREYHLAPDHSVSSLKWTIGDALSVVADDSISDQIIEIACDKRHGKAREMVVRALGNLKKTRPVDVLIQLLEDPEVSGHALYALGKLKAREAMPYISRFLDHDKAWIRDEAKRALAKIEKAAGAGV